jgi:hypothetical protein
MSSISIVSAALKFDEKKFWDRALLDPSFSQAAALGCFGPTFTNSAIARFGGAVNKYRTGAAGAWVAAIILVMSMCCSSNSHLMGRMRAPC